MVCIYSICIRNTYLHVLCCVTSVADHIYSSFIICTS